MPVYEVVMATGDWSVKLREEAPIKVRDAISVPFGHIVITGTWLPLGKFSTAQVLDAALYAGVCLRPGPTLEISGKGLAWWLDKGILESPLTKNAAGLTEWVSDIVTADVGTYPQSVTYFGSTAAGSLSTSFHYVTRRQAIDTVVRYYWGLEWRVRPTFELVVASTDEIYGAEPVAMVTARSEGYEPATGMWGLDGEAAMSLDWEAYATRVLAVGSDQIGGAIIASPYRNGLGSLVAAGQIIDAPLATEASAVTVAGNVLTPLTQPAYDYRLSADRYAISNRAPVGARINVCDPLNGFVDPANPVRFNGQTLFPRQTRLVGMRWPIQSGMGVYYRHYRISDGAEVWTDLSPYVEWEDGAAQLEVGARLRGLDGSDPSLASLRSTFRTGEWTEYAVDVVGLSLGDGTAVGWYRREGATLYVNIETVAGSTTAAGSGAWGFGLPTGLAAADSPTVERYQALSGTMRDVSTAATWRAIGEITAGDEHVYVHAADNAGRVAAGNVPFAIATGDTIALSGVIEIEIATETGDPPVIAAIADQTWPLNGPVVFAAELVSGTLPVTWTATGLPSGVWIDAASGAVRGDPPSATSGTATITATNSAGSDSETFNWTVTTIGALSIGDYQLDYPSQLALSSSEAVGEPVAAGGSDTWLKPTSITNQVGPIVWTVESVAWEKLGESTGGLWEWQTSASTGTVTVNATSGTVTATMPAAAEVRATVVIRATDARGAPDGTDTTLFYVWGYTPLSLAFNPTTAQWDQLAGFTYNALDVQISGGVPDKVVVGNTYDRSGALGGGTLNWVSNPRFYDYTATAASGLTIYLASAGGANPGLNLDDAASSTDSGKFYGVTGGYGTTIPQTTITYTVTDRMGTVETGTFDTW
jgi:hypothetical protein